MLSVPSGNDVVAASRIVEVCAPVVGRSYAAIGRVAIPKPCLRSFVSLRTVDGSVKAPFDIVRLDRNEDC